MRRAQALGCIALGAALLAGCQRSVVRLGKDEPILDLQPPTPRAGAGAGAMLPAGTAGASEKQSSVGPNAAMGEGGAGASLASAGRHGLGGGSGSSGGVGGKNVAGAGGAAGTIAGAAGVAPELPVPQLLPASTTPCPALTRSGRYTFMYALGGYSASVQIHIAPNAADTPGPGGPLILYWHASGTSASELDMALDASARAAVLESGGVLAAFESSVCSDADICTVSDGLGAWFAEDVLVADEVIACALAQAHIDPRRIHTLGFSAGAIQALYMAEVRSGYIASVVSFSGGGPPQRVMHGVQDPTNRVPALLTYGSLLRDVVIINLRMNSLSWYERHHPLGHYALMCDHGGAHHIPQDVARFALRFFADHPFKVAPEPYLDNLPVGAPVYCGNEP